MVDNSVSLYVFNDRSKYSTAGSKFRGEPKIVIDFLSDFPHQPERARIHMLDSFNQCSTDPSPFPILVLRCSNIGRQYRLTQTKQAYRQQELCQICFRSEIIHRLPHQWSPLFSPHNATDETDGSTLLHMHIGMNISKSGALNTSVVPSTIAK